MVCCFFFSDEPLGPDEKVSRHGYRPSGTLFQTPMMKAPCAECPSSCCWCFGQFFPLTSGCTQYFLRKKVLDGKMENYRCFQGQFTVCCCIKAGSCGEESCPDLCLCCEAHFCNGPAVSASRAFLMDKYDLMSDPCDNRLIRCNNCLLMLSCFCHVLALVDDSFNNLARILDIISDVVFHTVSGCMTAQVAHELDYREVNGMKETGGNHSAIAVHEPIGRGYHDQGMDYNHNKHHHHNPSQSNQQQYDKYGNPVYR